MKTEHLKTGFWGYKKLSVCQYITTLEEQFSAKLLEKDTEYQKVLAQNQEKIQQLEEELRQLRERCEKQEHEQMLIAGTLMDAQRYAGQLRHEAELREQDARQKLDAETARQEQALQQHDARIQQLRETFRTMLEEMDRSAEELAQRTEEVKADGPERNMLLFRRRKGPVA